MMANRLSSALKIVPKSWMEQTPGGFFPPAMQPRAHERASFASLHLTRHDPHGGSELSKDTTKFCASSPNKPPRTSTGHWPAFKALRTAGCRTVLRTALGVRLANFDNSATPAKKNRCHLMRTACSVNAYSSDRHQQRPVRHHRHFRELETPPPCRKSTTRFKQPQTTRSTRVYPSFIYRLMIRFKTFVLPYKASPAGGLGGGWAGAREACTVPSTAQRQPECSPFHRGQGAVDFFELAGLLAYRLDNSCQLAGHVVGLGCITVW